MKYETYNVYINHEAFNYIKEGKKKIEGRLEIGIFKNIKINDIINFVNNSNNEILTKKILKIDKFINFRDMLIDNITITLPWCSNLDIGVKYYENLYKKKLKNKIILAIHI